MIQLIRYYTRHPMQMDLLWSEPIIVELNVSLLCNFSEAPAKIKESYKLSRFIEEDGVELKKNGREAVGLCPFHDEKTPSLSINDDKGLYFCRGCGATGDIITYVATTKGLSYGKAISHLAKGLGLQLKSDGQDEQSRRTVKTNQAPARETRDMLVEVHDHVAAVAHRYLLSVLQDREHPVSDYILNDRKITHDDIYRFGIGFLPGDDSLWSIISTPTPCNPQPIDLPESQWKVHAIEAGLLNGHYETSMFQGRILFPITDTDGRCVAFSGRVVPALASSTVLGDRKYVNSPETHIFSKSSALFGLTPWRYALQDKKTATDWRSITSLTNFVLVEGLTDVIRLFKLGVRAVAAMGTSITEHHLRIILGRARTLVVITDGDQAGIDAAHKSMLTVLPLLRAGHVVFSACLPDGEDPDTYFYELDETPNPGEHFWHLVNGLHRHLPEEVWFDEYICHTSDPVTVADQVRIEQALALDSHAKLPTDPLWRLGLIRYISDITGYYTQPLVTFRSAYFTPRQQTDWILDDGSKFWLYRIARAPEILRPMTGPKIRAWWVKDAVNGLLSDATECPPALRLIFQAAMAAHGLADQPITDWRGLVDVLLRAHFPTSLLTAWASVVDDGDKSLSSLGYASEVLSPELWHVEFEEWVDSVEKNLNALLYQALSLSSD